MKRKKISLLLACVMATSMVLNPYASNEKKVLAEELNQVYLNSLEEEDKDFIYLSDIQHDSISKVAWGAIEKDRNPDKRTMQIKLQGENIEVDKGVGAHSDSYIYYDLEKYSDTYTRFVTYLAVDASFAGKGNGVNFKIYTSNDGSTWDLKHNSGTVKASEDARLVDIDISNAKFLKLVADDLGNNTADHSLYANAMLVKEGVKVEFNKQTDLIQRVGAYDELLRSHSVDKNIAENKNIILKRELVNQVGYQNLQKLYHQADKYKDIIDFLFNNEQALEYFMASGGVAKDGTYVSALKFYADIYEKYADDLNNQEDNYFNLRLATSVALAYGNTTLVRSWVGGNVEANALKRYETYQKLAKSGIFDKAGNTEDSAKWSTAQFKALTIPLMTMVVDARMNEDEFDWLASYALSQKEQKKSFLDAYNYISYGWGYNYNRDDLYAQETKAEFSEKYKFDEVLNSTYGDTNIKRLWMVFREGSVCGGLAKTYSNLAETFGRPSMNQTQPGHASTQTYMYNKDTKQYEWRIQNNVSGWALSGNEYGVRLLNWGNKSWNRWQGAPYVALATDAIETDEAFAKYRQATIINLLANSYDDLATKEAIYEKALKVQSINLDAFEGLVNVYKANTEKTSADFYKLAERVTNTYTYYPLTMYELNQLIKPSLTVATDKAKFDVITTNALNKAKVATRENVKQPDICKILAESLTGSVVSELATFSFDGDNANKIVINPSYDSSEIRVRYSFDGGVNWTQSDKHQIELTKEEIAKINATNDIRVGLVGTEDYHTIDIKDGQKVNLVKNDLENRLIGNVANLEISFDGGQKWCNYTEDMRINGSETILARYKANGTTLQSASVEYKFEADVVDEKRSYISIDEIKSIAFSSEQNTGDQAGKNMVDGNDNTKWHTKWYVTNDAKFFTVEFEEAKYITAVEYLASLGGNNGKLKDVVIYTSMTGEEDDWVKSGEKQGLTTTVELKDIKLDNPTLAKFVKIQATATYGNSNGEANRYFSGRAFNFYEDKTVKEEVKEEVVVEEVVENTAKQEEVVVEEVVETPTVQEEVAEEVVEDTAKQEEVVVEEVTENTTTPEEVVEEVKEVKEEAKEEVDTTNWISTRTILEDNFGTIIFSSLNTIKLSNPVTVYFALGQNVELLDNNGTTQYTFKENGTHVFKLRNKLTNQIKLVPVKVDWILK